MLLSFSREKFVCMRSDYILIICDMSNINDKCGGILGEMIFYFYSKFA